MSGELRAIISNEGSKPEILSRIADIAMMGNSDYILLVNYRICSNSYFSTVSPHRTVRACTVALHSRVRLYTVMILSFRTDMPGQTVQTQFRLLLEGSSLIWVCTVCHSVCVFWTLFSMVEPIVQILE